MVLPIDYSDLLILVLAVFTFVGVMRGWYKEALTTLVVAVLAVLVWQPSIAQEIVDVINKVIKLIVMFVQAGFSLDVGKISAQTVDPGWLLDPNSYGLYTVVTVILLIGSYLIGDLSFKTRVTPLGRLLGGFLGLCNGYVIVSLIRQYVLNYLRSKNQAFVASGELSMKVIDLPAKSFFAGYGIIFVFVLVIGVIALLVAGDRIKLPLK
jgi:uncharacterized membrane protein required for colicin V production